MIQDIEPHVMLQAFREDRAEAESPVFVFEGRKLLLRRTLGGLRIFRAYELPKEAELRFALRLDGTAYYYCTAEGGKAALGENEPSSGGSDGTGDGSDVKESDGTSDGGESSGIHGGIGGKDHAEVLLSGGESTGGADLKTYAAGLSEIRGSGILPKEQIFAAYTAAHIARWHAENKFCGRCGKVMEDGLHERSLVCPECGKVVYPRLDPAVICAVTSGDEIILTRYADRPFKYNALIAGYAEVGETLEDTVRREVMEEVGLEVESITYYKSQPWALSGCLLAGFFCRAKGDLTIHRQESELASAIWTRREDIELQPDDYSLTNEMMTAFKEGKEPPLNG